MYTSDLIQKFNSSVSSNFSKYLKLVWVNPIRKFWAFELVNTIEYYDRVFDQQFMDSIKLEILKNTIGFQNLDLIQQIPYGDIPLFQITNPYVTDNFQPINFGMNLEYMANMFDFYQELANQDNYLTDYFQLEYMEVIDNESRFTLPEIVLDLIRTDEEPADLDNDVSICKYHLISNEFNFYSLTKKENIFKIYENKLRETIDTNDDFFLSWDFKNHTLDLYIWGWC